MANITDEQIRGVFDLFDADGSGFVDAEELGLVLQALGFGNLSKEEVDGIVQDIAADGSSHIEFPEFKKMCKSRMAQRDSPEEVNKAFHAFDQDSKGTITLDDFVKIAEELGEFNVGEAPEGEQKEGAEKAQTSEEKKAAFKALFADIIKEANANVVTEDEPAEGALTLKVWKKMMRDAVTDKRHRIDEATYSIKTRARVAKRGPFGVKVEEGKTYYWCSCGMSKTQPFCDGSHEQFNKDHGSTFEPVKFMADSSRTVWMCGCKQTKAPPFCDGTHTSL